MPNIYHNFRFLFYIIIIIALLNVDIAQEKKSVKITQKSQVVNVKLVKQIEKPVVVQKKAPKPKKVLKKVKKKKIVKKKPPIKKVKKKKLIKKPLVPKPDPQKILKKELEQKKLEEERLEKERLKKEQIEKEKQEELEKERLEKERVKKEYELQKRREYVASLKESYYTQIYNTIASKKRYPKKALRFKKEGSVRVSFTILADGTFRDFKITQPSDEKIFNKAVKKLFRKLDTFEIPPSDIKLPLEVSITINYNIKRN